MADISDYTGLITTEHSDKPKFMAMIEAVVQPMVDALNASQGLPADFDLDQAIGAQLDIVGLWVGISRNVNAPLSGVYFSLDIVGLGFDQGAWKGPFDPDTGIISLDDETYRTLIRAKIGANRWDGTLGQSKQILDLIFSGDTHVFIEDRQDMSILLGISGEIPSAVFLALLTGGYIPIKPEGVRMAVYVVTSVSGAPIFGLDMNNEYVGGFDVGAWGGTPDNVVYPQPLAFDFMSGVLDSLISFSRPGPGIRVNASGVFELVAANQPRFDYDPVTLQPRGLLMEEQRTNFWTYNSQFDNAAWNKVRSSIQPDAALAPDGTMSADRFIESTDADNSHTIGQKINLNAGDSCVLSICAKAAERSTIGFRFYADNSVFTNSQSVIFDLANGVLGSVGTGITASIIPMRNGWFRCIAIRTAAASGLASLAVTTALNSTTWKYTGDGTSGVYIWRAQSEIGPFATSIIPTTSAQVTRAADVASITVPSGFTTLTYDYDDGTSLQETVSTGAHTIPTPVAPKRIKTISVTA